MRWSASLWEIGEHNVYFDNTKVPHYKKTLKQKATVVRTKVQDYGASVGGKPLHVDTFNAILTAALAQKDPVMRQFARWWTRTSYNWTFRRTSVVKIHPRLWFMMRACADDCPALFYRIDNLYEAARARRERLDD